MPTNTSSRPPQRQISPEREQLYYAGMALAAVGLLMFLSTFVTFLMHFGDFSNFNANARSDGFRAIGGMILMIVGSGLMAVGRAGAAGSGLKLDPEEARRDVEPWARMSGGVLHDTLDEAGINLNNLTGGGSADNELPFDEKLRRLHKLHADGLLTDEEYVREKQELLDKN